MLVRRWAALVDLLDDAAWAGAARVSAAAPAASATSLSRPCTELLSIELNRLTLPRPYPRAFGRCNPATRMTGLMASGVAPSARVRTTRTDTALRRVTTKRTCEKRSRCLVAHGPPAEALAQPHLEHDRLPARGRRDVGGDRDAAGRGAASTSGCVRLSTAARPAGWRRRPPPPGSSPVSVGRDRRGERAVRRHLRAPDRPEAARRCRPRRSAASAGPAPCARAGGTRGRRPPARPAGRSAAVPRRPARA